MPNKRIPAVQQESWNGLLGSLILQWKLIKPGARRSSLVVWSQGFCLCRVGYRNVELGKLSAGLGVMKLHLFCGLWNWTCTNDGHLVDVSQEISLEYLTSVPGGDLDSATLVWVAHPLQATENRLLIIEKGVNRQVFCPSDGDISTLQVDSPQAARIKSDPQLQQ